MENIKSGNMKKNKLIFGVSIVLVLGLMFGIFAIFFGNNMNFENEPIATYVNDRFEVYNFEGENVTVDTITGLMWRQELGFENDCWGIDDADGICEWDNRLDGHEYNSTLEDSWKGSSYDDSILSGEGVSIANFPAAEHCANSSYAGFTDWRLPADQGELLTILAVNPSEDIISVVHDSRTHECDAVDCGFNNNNNSDAFINSTNWVWTANGACGFSGDACLVNLESGGTLSSSRSTIIIIAVTCVR